MSAILLSTFVFYAIGCAQTVNFIMHSVCGAVTAQTISWAQSPFRLELAFSSLGTAVIAFVVYGERSQFRSKVATAVFAYGAAGGHVFQMVVHHDLAVNNTGLLLAMDIILPTFGIAVVAWHAIARRRAPHRTPANQLASDGVPVR